ncbi:MAG TPA: nitronate monooxygenase [Luteolibacter sp.]|nr:nitronate monooxygenase [Luteolibacter sp.]
MNSSTQDLPELQEGASAEAWPVIIQGGMGVAVSNWRLAREVSSRGHLGVVSGTALNTVLVRRLQCGDPGGHMRRALAACPLVHAAERIQERYFIEGGKATGAPFQLSQLFSLHPSRDLNELTVVANFVEVFLAKEGHAGRVGINLLEKIQLPTLASIYGAMLAGVDFVLMGAGIPRTIPGVLNALAAGNPTQLRIAVLDAGPGQEATIHFDPADLFGGEAPQLVRPRFLAIVSSSTLAMTLARKANGRVDGFVVEGLSAGGHNAPPRGGMTLSESGEPIYGPRDEADLAAIRALGLPFWIAGSCAHPDKLREAQAQGAVGVQIGTPFAFCEESGLDDAIKATVLARSSRGGIELRTDPLASPTGMPFKVVVLPGTVADEVVYEQRERGCDLGYLRMPYQKPSGEVGYRCPAEAADDYERKGGVRVDAKGRKCLCNGLMAAIGLGQCNGDWTEAPILTAGSDIAELARFLREGCKSYTAADVLRYVLGSPMPAC